MTTRRPWHVPPPWPVVTASVRPSRAEVGQLVTAAQERHTRRLHGAA